MPSSTPIPAASPARRSPGGASSACRPARALAVLSGAGADELASALRMDPALTVAGPADGRYLVRAADPDALGTALAAAPRPPAASAWRWTRRGSRCFVAIIVRFGWLLLASLGNRLERRAGHVTATETDRGLAERGRVRRRAVTSRRR